ncbi:MAG: hypothetical protein ACE5KM_19855 [Planctomycetaceae bacterium]
MSPYDLSELRANDGWQRVLAAYVAEQRVRRTVEPDHSGWVARINTVEGVEQPHLPRIHGRLIAYGLLKFQLAGRNEGVLYQVSAFGKDALAELRGQRSDAEVETADEAA